MNRLDRTEQAQIIRALIEGNSLRSVSRMTGFARNTISTLLVQLGEACSEYQDRVLRNLTPKRIEADEIWSFCYAKAKNVPEDKSGTFGYGDVWTWVAVDPDTKLVPAWLVGTRDEIDCRIFIRDLGSRIVSRVPTDHGRTHALQGCRRADLRDRRRLRAAHQGLRRRA